MMMKFILVLVLGWVATGAWAAERDGVTLPDTQTVNHKPLVLNGMGTRKATLFAVKVYIGGLYLDKKEKDPAAILASKELKKMDTKFVHEVGVKKIRDAWQEGFDNNCAKDCERLKPQMAQLLAAMTDIKEGDTLSYTLAPEYVEVSVKGATPIKIAGEGMGRVMLSTWIGDNPSDKDLKKGLLGLTD